ncbi:MAG: CRISPR system precrRNA processing endoribonuclease RAMP protein Cas6 [Anaerolineae bacterium]
MNEFRVARYRLDIESVEPLHLPPYKGSTFRGGFGYAFKKIVCGQRDRRACTSCEMGNDCPYGYIFETNVPPDSEVLRSLQKVPRPFVIQASPDRRRSYPPGSALSLYLVLVGRAINYLPYFLLAFQELGRAGIGKSRGKYVLQRINSVHPWRATQELVYDGVDVRVGGQDLSVSYAEVVARAATLPAERLRLRFLSPTRLRHRGKPLQCPPFHVLVRRLLDRVSSLSYFHCGQRWEADFRGLVEQAQEVELTVCDTHWVNVERYSSRQRARLSLGGFVGDVVYAGDLTPFLPLLCLGELVHVGKAAVFGNGRYRMEIGDWRLTSLCLYHVP